MEHDGLTSRSAPNSNFFVTPAPDRTNHFKAARTAAKTNAMLATIYVSTAMLFLAFYLISQMQLSNQTPLRISLTIAFVVVLPASAAWWVTLLVWTKKRQSRMGVDAFTRARQIMYESIDAHEKSKKCRLNIVRLFDQLKWSVENAESEFKANRFATFWDSIEQSAAKLAEIQAAIDHMRLLQREYDNRLNGYSHNLPQILPGRSAIPTDTPMIERYYAIIRHAQTKIDFALIWEHRQTRAVMVAGFATLGEMVQNVGESVRKSIQQLIAVESAPRYSVGFIR